MDWPGLSRAMRSSTPRRSASPSSRWGGSRKGSRLRVNVLEELHRVLGTDVAGVMVVIGAVATDGNGRHVEGAEPLTDRREGRGVAGVPGEEEPARRHQSSSTPSCTPRSANHVARPRRTKKVGWCESLDKIGRTVDTDDRRRARTRVAGRTAWRQVSW